MFESAFYKIEVLRLDRQQSHLVHIFAIVLLVAFADSGLSGQK